jgi:O-acetylhomoserine/O-acetylserine sulfhydrylase-like pyridoxal-dependent enzyme
MDVQSRSAMQVVRFLAQHPNVEDVWYPGLEGSAGHAVSRRYLWLADGPDDYGEPVNRYGALLSFTVKGGMPAARRVFDQLKLIWRAADLGRIKSLATIPAISTHQQQGAAGRQLAGMPEHMIRLSVGAEATTDLIDDLDQALVVAAG